MPLNGFAYISELFGKPEFSVEMLSDLYTKMPVTGTDELQRISNAFIPIATGQYGNAQLIMDLVHGKMSNYAGGEIGATSLPGLDYIRFNEELEVAEQVVFGKKDLEETNKLIENLKLNSWVGKIAAANAVLRRRFVNYHADMVRQFVNKNTFSVDDMGRIISASGVYGDATRSKYHLDLNDSPATHFTDVRDLTGDYAFDLGASSFLWGQENANPIDNLRQLVTYITEVLMREPVRIYIPQILLDKMGKASEIISLINRHSYDRLAERNATENIATLISLDYETTSQMYTFATSTTSAITAGATTTFTVADPNGIEEGDYIIIESLNHVDSYDAQVSDVTTNTVTIPALNGGDTIPVGSRVTTKKPIIDKNKIVVELADKSTQWLAKPNVWAGSMENPGLGYFSKVGISSDERKPEAYAMAGFKGNLQVHLPNFVTLKVK